MSKAINITNEIAKKLLPTRPTVSNKGTFGKVLNIAGSINYQGAAYFSSLAPLKIGAGLVTLASTNTIINNLASTMPWVTLQPLSDFENKCISHQAINEIKNIINSYDVISIGPGLSTLKPVEDFVITTIEYLNTTDKKVVIDADALNIIAKRELTQLPKNSVITPHPMELSRLINVSVEEIQKDRIHYANYTQEKYNCNVILKGNESIISLKDKTTYQNSTGNSSLAKAGSGDVLTGIISGLSAQGLSIENASVLGVYIHGLCGEIASEDLTEYCVLATDQINYIPNAIKYIMETSK